MLFPRSHLSPSPSSPPLPPITSFPPTTLAAVYAETGSITSVLRLLPIHLPSCLSPGQLLLRFLAAPINPSDLNTVEGVYPIRPPSLPATAGNEGVAEVVAASPEVTAYRPGDWVTMRAPAFGTWRQWAVAPVDAVDAVPHGLSVHQAAVLSVNPCTAFRLLTDYVRLPEGGTVVQNGSTSAVGQSVVQMARILGLRCVDVIRPRPTPRETEETVARLRAMGSSQVLVDSGDLSKQLSAIDGAQLALNCVGGKEGASLFRAMAPGGTMVTYGGMSRRPLQVPTSALVFKEVQCRGFFMSRWNERASQQERTAMREAVAGWMREGRLSLPVEEFPLSDIAGALKRYHEPYKARKVLLRC